MIIMLENKRYRWLVYIDSDTEEVLGYAYIGPFRLVLSRRGKFEIFLTIFEY